VDERHPTRSGGRAGKAAVDISSQLADQVDGAHGLHRRGIAHGDVKPENLLIDDELNVKLADFGASVPMTKRRFSWIQLPAVIEGTPEHRLRPPSEGRALLHLAGAVAVAFVGTVAAIILLSVALR